MALSFIAASFRAALAEDEFDSVQVMLVGAGGSGQSSQGSTLDSLGAYSLATPQNASLQSNSNSRLLAPMLLAVPNAASPNQRRVDSAVDALPAGSPIRAALLGQPDAVQQRAMDLLSGAHYANLPSLMQERDIGYGFGLLRRQASLASRAGFTEYPTLPARPVAATPPPVSAVAGLSTQDFQVDPQPTIYRCDPCEGYANQYSHLLALPSLVFPTTLVSQVWAEMDIDTYHLNSDGNGPKSKLYGPGVSVGYEVATTGGWMGGAAFKFGDKTLKTKSHDARSDIDAYSFALYGAKSLRNRYGPLRLSLGTSYNRYNIRAVRHIDIAGYGDRLSDRYHADSWQIFAEAAQSFYVGRSVIEPFLAGSWSHVRTGSISERGGAAALYTGDHDFDNGATVLGTRGFMPLSERFGVEASAGWRHLYGSRRPTMNMGFQAGGELFDVQGTAMDRDALVYSAAVEMMILPNLSMKTGYDGSVGKRGVSHAWNLQAAYRF